MPARDQRQNHGETLLQRYLKAIETEYNDLRFRSRLEARWAIFFDAISIPYLYEPEGYHLGSLGNYLPDFWLPNHEYWIEIKGRRPSPIEINRLKALVYQSGAPGFLLWGEISLKPHDDAHWGYIPTYNNRRTEVIHTPNQIWTECPKCHTFSLSDHGAFRDCACTSAIPSPTSPALAAAYKAARTARFEFGENGSKPKRRWRRK